MDFCRIVDNFKYKELKNKSSAKVLDVINAFNFTQENLNRSPYMDEIEGSDSRKYLKKELKMDSNDSTDTGRVLEFTLTNNTRDALLALNNEYRDLKTDVIDFGEVSIIKSTPMPVKVEGNTSVKQDDVMSNRVCILNAMDELRNSLGIEIIPITNNELMLDKWNDKIPNVALVNAFIYEGKIYVNTDNADIDAPIHEMLHILLGGIKYTDSNLYQSLVESVTLFSNYNILSGRYPNRTLSDVNEEIFVTQMAKYFSNMESGFNNMDTKTIYEIFYNMRRMLDHILMGKNSTKSIGYSDMINMSLRLIAGKVGSDALLSKYSFVSRTLNNAKQLLMKQGLLKEIC